MKKVLAVVLVVCVVCAAGSAFAQNRQQRNGRDNFEPCNCERGQFEGRRGGFEPGMRGGFEERRMMFAPDMPKEIREKAVELAKLHIDLEEALSSRPVNKEKALEVHAKMQKLEQEIEAWKFAQRLERIEAAGANPEHNRRAHPMPNAPKPENAPELPDTTGAPEK